MIDDMSHRAFVNSNKIAKMGVNKLYRALLVRGGHFWYGVSNEADEEEVSNSFSDSLSFERASMVR